MARYIDADKITTDFVQSYTANADTYLTLRKILNDVPTADIVEVETIKAWLYEMAINNVGCVLKGDLSNVCEEIISRLDGLRSFAKEHKQQKEKGE